MDIPPQVVVAAGSSLKLLMSLGGSVSGVGISGAHLQPVPGWIRALRAMGPVNAMRTVLPRSYC